MKKKLQFKDVISKKENLKNRIEISQQQEFFVEFKRNQNVKFVEFQTQLSDPVIKVWYIEWYKTYIIIIITKCV